jgi:hypothetical protein
VKRDSHYFLSVLLQAGGNFIARRFFSSRSLLKQENGHLGGASNSHKIPNAAENTNTNTNVTFNGISTVIEIFERSKIVRALDMDTEIGSYYLPSSFSYSSAL